MPTFRVVFVYIRAAGPGSAHSCFAMSPVGFSSHPSSSNLTSLGVAGVAQPPVPARRLCGTSIPSAVSHNLKHYDLEHFEVCMDGRMYVFMLMVEIFSSNT